ncbi:MAG: YVTN family beta-propeller protein [Paraglaciecola sp.]|jgi:YVTN family beta-propeller protein
MYSSGTAHSHYKQPTPAKIGFSARSYFHPLNTFLNKKLKSRGLLLMQLVLMIGLLATTSIQAAPFAYITNLNSGDLSVIDTATQSEVARVNMGADKPGTVAVHPDGKTVVVGLEQLGLAFFDTTSNSVTDFMSLPGGITSIKLSEDGNTAFVTHAGGRDLLSIVDLQTHAVIKEISMFDVFHISLSIDGSALYASSALGDFVARIDRSSYTVLDNLAVPGSPVYSVAHPSLNRLYVSSHSDDAITVIDTDGFSVVKTIAVGNEPNVMVLSPDGSKLYVACQRDENSLWVIDTETETVTAAIPGPGEGSVSTDILPDGSEIYISNWSDDSVSVIDSQSLEIIKTIPVGSNPFSPGRFIGGPVTTLNGVVKRLSTKRIECHNFSTGQTVHIHSVKGLDRWDCEAAGLIVNVGDKISIRITGKAQ